MNRFDGTASPKVSTVDNSIISNYMDENTNIENSKNKDDEMKEINRKKTLYPILATHGNVVLYAACFWIQIGVLPYLSKELNANAVVFGYLQTTFAVVQLLGGPLYGRFGDVFGGRAALVLSYFSASASYGILSISSNIVLLFLSRLPSIGMHSMQGSQMVITDLTHADDRVGELGRLGVSYGIGMVVGPILGGFITEKFSEHSAAFVAAIGSLLSVVLAFILIPSNTKAVRGKTDDAETDETEKKSKTSSVFDFKQIARLLRVRHMAYLLAIKLICGIPFGLFQSMFSIFAMEYFKLGPKENGIVLSYAGIIGMVVQGFLAGMLSRRFTDSTLLKWSIATITVSYLFMIMVTDIYAFCFVLLPLVAGGSILQVVITSNITKIVPPQDTGIALGLSMATHSLIRAVSPMLGGMLFQSIGFSVFGIVGFGINSILTGYLFLYGRQDVS